MAEKAAPGEAERRLAVREAARTLEPDRYLSALLAPRQARDDLVTLAAYFGEVGRVPAVVSEPMIGEIRLQWWRDVLSGGASDARTGNPVADALLELIRRQELPLDLITGVLDARVSDLYSDQVPDEETFNTYLDVCDGAPFALAARILGVADTPDARAVINAAAHAYGTIRLLLAIPMHKARGRTPFPQAQRTEVADGIPADVIGMYSDRAHSLIVSAQQGLRHVCATQRSLVLAAILPAALVGPYLRVLQEGSSGERRRRDLTPLARVWRLWRAHRTGRLA